MFLALAPTDELLETWLYLRSITTIDATASPGLDRVGGLLSRRATRSVADGAAEGRSSFSGHELGY